MKPAALLVVAATVAVGANASVELFFTSSADPYGLRVPSLAFLPTAGNGTDYRDGYELAKDAGGAYLAPPLGPPPDVVLDGPSGRWAYIWGRFRDEPTSQKITRIDIGVNGAPAGQGSIAWYVCDNRSDEFIGTARWNGDPQYYFYWNPISLLAITAAGIGNRTSDLPWNLYVGADYRTFLLGAVRCATCPGELTFAPSTQAYTGPPELYTPIDTQRLNKVLCVPEPTSVLLLAAAGLAVRR